MYSLNFIDSCIYSTAQGGGGSFNYGSNNNAACWENKTQAPQETQNFDHTTSCTRNLVGCEPTTILPQHQIAAIFTTRLQG